MIFMRLRRLFDRRKQSITPVVERRRSCPPKLTSDGATRMLNESVDRLAEVVQRKCHSK